MLQQLLLLAGQALGDSNLGHEALCGHGPSLMLSGSSVCHAAPGFLPNITDESSAAQSWQCQGDDCASPRRHPWTHTTPCFHRAGTDKEYCVFTDTNFAEGRGISLVMEPRRASYLATLPAFVEPQINEGINQDLVRTVPAKYAVKEIPSKGMGLVATEHIRRGDVILANTASLMIDYGAFSLPQDEYLQLAAAAADHLPGPHRAALLNLSSHDGRERTHAEHVDKVIRTNAFDIYPDEDEDGEGAEILFVVFPEIARMNHDCRPNAEYRFDRGALAQHVTALRDIAPGEELTLTYIDPEESRGARMRRLEETWGFRCACPACSMDRARAAESDARIAQIQRLWKASREEDRSRGKGGGGGSSPEMAELIISLYEQERLWGKLPGAYYFAAIEYNGAGDPWTATKYARLAIEVGIPILGEDADDVREMRKLAEDPRKHWSWMASVKGDGRGSGNDDGDDD